MTAFSFEALRRFPSAEAPNLFASDAADRLILDTAEAALHEAGPGAVAVIGDQFGALTLGAAALYGARGIRVHQDPLSGERALAANAELGLVDSYRHVDLTPDAFEGVRVVLVRIPKSLDALDDIARAISDGADTEVAVFAGGMVKHLTHASTDVLLRSFTSVRAGLARQKARVLTVEGPRIAAVDAGSRVRSEFDTELSLWVCARGGTFAGPRVDIGTRFLLSFLDELRPDAASAVDLGCGTGVVASALARARPGMSVIATDESAAAISSAAATAVANGLGDRIRLVRDDLASTLSDASVDVVLLNPPFHSGTTIQTGTARAMFEAAARILKPGGELWTVWNSHLGYASQLGRIVGPTRQVGRNPKFTVSVSTR